MADRRPTYDDLLAALRSVVEEAGPQFGNDDRPGTINRMARHARLALQRHHASVKWSSRRNRHNGKAGEGITGATPIYLGGGPYTRLNFAAREFLTAGCLDAPAP